MAGQDNIVEELKTGLERRRQGPLKKGCRGSRLVERMLADRKRHPPDESSPHQVSKVLGLLSRQGLLLAVELESPPIVCCRLLVTRLGLQGVAVLRRVSGDKQHQNYCS